MLTFLVNGEEVTVSKEETANYKRAALSKGQAFLDFIQDVKIRELASTFWHNAPDYFFIIPASASGKYHWATEKGGLFEHVLMAMYCAYELLITYELNPYEKDLALASVAGHDCIKYGIDYDKRYFDMHPFLPRSYYGKLLEGDYESADIDTIFTAIERHMGGIGSGQWTSVAGVKPETPLQQVVHLADFMASRKHVIMQGFGTPSNMTPNI